MDVILVDDDIASLSFLEGLCSMVPYVRVTGTFLNASDACTFAKSHPPDLALLDIVMPDQNGLDLCDRLREDKPDIAVFFTTSSDNFALSAFRKRALAYLTKPYSYQELFEALERAKKLCDVPHTLVDIRTFGHFDVFHNGKPLIFPRQKCKELFAYLVDRKGSAVTMEQMIDILWENRAFDKSVRAYAHVILRDLKVFLKSLGLSELLISTRNQTALDLQSVSCDYYRFLNGDPVSIRSYEEEYMIDYSWAENTNAVLSKKKQILSNNC